MVWLRRLAAVVAALAVVTGAASAIYVGSVSHTFDQHLQRSNLMPGGPGPQAADRPAKATPDEADRPAPGVTSAVNYVLMGSDSRQATHAGAGRSDTLMVLHLTADRRHAYLISFPRDLYVAVPGHGKSKINAAFSWGGPQLAVRTLENLLDTRMDHAALIDFDGFIALTDALGGVTVVNRHASSSRGYAFPAGPITVRGDQALAYVRERYDLPRGDLDRAQRQRDVVHAILAKGLSARTVADPARFSSFVAGVAQHVTVDDGLGSAEIRRTALSLRLGSGDVRQLQAPISGFATVRGQSVDVVDGRQMSQLAAALRGDDLETYLRAHPGN